MNCVAVSGRIGKDDPVLQYSSAGNAWGGFSLAIDVGRDKATNEKKTVWFEVKVFGRQAETISQYFKSGDGIEVVGEFDLETWNDKTSGAPRKRTTIVLRSFSFPPALRDDNGGGQQRQQGQPAAQRAQLLAPQAGRQNPPGRPGQPPRPGSRTVSDLEGIDDIPF